MIRRWTFEPARLDGRPVVFWLSASVDFNIFGSISPARASRPACFERPHIGDDDAQEKVLITATLMGSSGVPATRPNVPINTRTIRRWVRITEAGAVVDVLLGTSTGFMRLSKPLIDQMAQASRYQRPVNPSGCWHLEQIPLNR